jgi:hypothetical protein
MRRSTHRSSLLVAILLVSTAVAPACAEENTLPARKPGLWELKTVMDEGNGPRDQTLKMCIDERMEQNTIAASLADHKSNCAKYDIKVTDGVTTAEGECTYNGRLVISHTEMKGDFKSAFEIKIKSSTSDPEAKERSIVIKRDITQSGSYLGESCGDLKAGEAMGPDGQKIAVQ